LNANAAAGRLAVVALSARGLAEAAARDGFTVIALDCFGDRDTQRAAKRWLPIGAAGELQIDDTLLLHGLEQIAQRDEASGWIAGSGFEGRPDLLQRGAELLPLIGNVAATVRRVRDPRGFFNALDACGIAHPPVLHAWPVDANGWLLKDAGACGGGHIRRAVDVAQHALPPGCYLQRERAGTPMSATLIADARRAVVLGCNEQLTRADAAAPWVYAGVIGPVRTTDAATREVHDAAQSLVRAFGVRGLCSLDFLRDGERIEVLELNPRPSASVELYAPEVPGLVRAHVRACAGTELTPLSVHTSGVVRGNRIVFARGPIEIDARAADWLAQGPGVHDLPQPGSRFAPGDPLCSVSASGASADAVRAALTERCTALLAALEPLQ
jgi:uncharacterized protein